MGKISEYIKSAIKQIIHNGYRTLMTMLGIVIGIAAVIAVVALGNGMSDYVKTEFNGLVGNYGMINIDSTKTTDAFSVDDLYLLENSLPDIKGASPNFETYGKVKGPRGTYATSMNGGAESQVNALANPIIKGQYFTKQMVETGQRVCVMLRTDAVKLFGTEECIGKEVEISVSGKTASYTVVGLREQLNSMANMMMSTADYTAILEIPYTSCASDFGFDIDRFGQIVIYADQDILQERVNQAQILLEQHHGLRGANAIMAFSMADISGYLDELMGIISKFLILVAVISLVVGGIGIMNIMLVSVTERTKEIGIRKSIGARTGAIMAQFLSESAILTLLGGVIGIIVGIGISFVICHLLGFKLIMSAAGVLGAAAFSIVIGLIFGLYPALKAAKMKPIDALRV